MIDDAQTHQPMPITVRVREACRITGIGRSKLYELIAVGEIDIVKVGTITLVPVASLVKFLQRDATNARGYSENRSCKRGRSTRDLANGEIFGKI